MPIYEYKCCNCGEDFEEYVATAAAATQVTCTICGSGNIQRSMSMFGFASRGGGGEVVTSGRSGHNCSGCASHNCGHCH